MNSIYKQEEPLRGIIEIDFQLEEIADDIKKRLNEVRKNITMPGFRAGKVPNSIVEQRFGNSVRYEIAENKAIEELQKVIKDKNLNIVAGPIRHDLHDMDDNKINSFKYKFVFALAPEMRVVLDDNVKMPFYEVEPSEEKIKKEDERYRYSTHEIVEVSDYKENDHLEGHLEELDEEGNPLADGINIEKAIILPLYFKDENEKNKFGEVKKDSVVKFNPYKAYGGSAAILADLFGIDRNDAENHQGDFSFTVNKINRHIPSEINEEFFKKVFGEKTEISNEEQYRQHIAEQLKNRYENEARILFQNQIIDYLLEKNGTPELDKETFLTIFKTNDREKNKGKERTEQEYKNDIDSFVKYVYYDQSLKQFLEQIGRIIEPQDIENAIKERLLTDMYRYGYNISGMESLMDQLMEARMKDERAVQEAEAMVREKAIGDYAFEKVSLDRKKVSEEEFEKIRDEYFNKKNQQIAGETSLKEEKTEESPAEQKKEATEKKDTDTQKKKTEKKTSSKKSKKEENDSEKKEEKKESSPTAKKATVAKKKAPSPKKKKE